MAVRGWGGCVWSMVLAAGSRWLGIGGGGWQLVPVEGFLDALGGGGADALVDRQCLPQVLRGLAGVAVVEVAVAESLQGASFFLGRAEVAGDGQRLDVLVACLAGGRGPERELTEAVQRFGLAERLPELAAQLEGVLMAGGGGRVVPGQLLHHAEVVEGPGAVGPIAQIAEDLQGLTDLGTGGRVVAGPRQQYAEEPEYFGLALPVTQAAVQLQRAGQIHRGGQVVAGL